MGKLSITFDVVGPVTLPQSLSYYGRNGFGSNNDLYLDVLVKQACQLAHDSYNLDFSSYDLNKDGIIDNVFMPVMMKLRVRQPQQSGLNGGIFIQLPGLWMA